MERVGFESSHAGSSDNGTVERILTFLEAGYCTCIDATMMAKAARCSRRTLARITRKHWHCTPRELIARYRMHRARDLLGQGWKIEAVVLAVGYRSRINFYRTFRRHLGCAPSEYRPPPHD